MVVLPPPIKVYIKSNCYSLTLFFVIFLFVAIINIGKCFNNWDEFSFWGVFIKETLRTNQLFCRSPLNFSHKDYLPAFTLFEALWCKLSLGFGEADAFRSIQILQFSIILPVIVDKNRIKSIIKTVILSIIPLCIHALSIYHTIYQDVLFAYILFFCMWIAYNKYEDEKYKIFLLTLSLSMLAMVKMTAVLFVLLVDFYLIAKVLLKIENLKIKGLIISLIIPLLFWFSLNKYIGYYSPMDGSQSYAGLSLHSLKNVLLNNGEIPYQHDVTNVYLAAMFKNRPIFEFMPYSWIMTIVIISLLSMSFIKSNSEKKTNLLLITGWTFVSSLVYAYVMYFLYCTSFSEYESVFLASYERYIISFVFATILLAISIWFENEKSTTYLSLGVFAAICIASILILFPENSLTLLPNNGGRDIEMLQTRALMVNPILETIPLEEGETVFCVMCGDDGETQRILNYDAFPIEVTGKSVGPQRYDGDIYSVDYDVDEFEDIIDFYKYIYFINVDDIFIEKYKDVFPDPSIIKNGNIFINK